MPTTTLDALLTKVQHWSQNLPLLIIGSGHSMAYSVPGMDELREHIMNELDAHEMDANDKAAWLVFRPILAETDLETAMQKQQLSPNIEDALLRIVHKLFTEHDGRLFLDIARGNLNLALTQLFRFYLRRTTQKHMPVITTNYDRLIEFAADAADVAAYTGFTNGCIRHFNSEHPWQSRSAKGIRPQIELWKVHGSTDWYRTPKDRIIAATLPKLDDEDFTPLMIYPGMRKYESAWAEPYRTVISQTDEAIQKAELFIVIGYGFNDPHIQPKLVERIQDSAIPLICLTKTLTPSARTLLLSGRCRKFVALESSTAGTTIYADDNLEGVDIPGSHWDISGFLKLIQ